MLELVDVSVEFDDGPQSVIALNHVDLVVESGQFLVLHGPSGSGKSTLINAAAGLQPVVAGSVRVDGAPIEEMSNAQIAELRLRRIGVVFQDNNLISEFDALENVQLPLSAQGLRVDACRSQALAALELVGLLDVRNRRPAQLSGGQKQRVGIARAMVGGKAYLLADEPTGALDRGTSDQVFRVMRTLASQGVGVLVASHDPRALDWADREARIVDGRMDSKRAGVPASPQGAVTSNA